MSFIRKTLAIPVTVTLVICSLICLLPAQDQKPSPATQTANDATAHGAGWKFTDTGGRDHEPFADKSVMAMVIVFIATDCPIANYYQPTINRLRDRYGSKGVRFLLFYSDPDITAGKAKKHVEAYKIKSPVILDARLALAKRLKATTAPEAFVIGRDGVTKYRGRIDDIYVAWGKRRRAPTSNDLKDALDAVLAGKVVSAPATKPVGCEIPFGLEKGNEND